MKWNSAKNEVLRNSHGLHFYYFLIDSQYRTILSWGSESSFIKQAKWFVRTSKVLFSDSIFEILGYRVLFCVVLSSAKWFGTEFREIAFYFCSTERNSELCSLLWNGSERNSENLHLFWFHGTEFRVVFSSAEVFGTELWEFASIFIPRNGIPSCFLFRGRVRNGIPRFFVPRNNRNSVGNNHLFRQFRLPRNYFFVGNSQP